MADGDQGAVADGEEGAPDGEVSAKDRRSVLKRRKDVRLGGVRGDVVNAGLMKAASADRVHNGKPKGQLPAGSGEHGWMDRVGGGDEIGGIRSG